MFLLYFIMWWDPYLWWFGELQRECHRASPEIQEGQKSSSWFYTFRELNQESCNATWCSYTGWCGSRSSQCWLCPQLCKKELVEFGLLPCLSVIILLFFSFLVLILNSFNAGTMLELSEAIRDYHDHTGLPQMVCYVMAFLMFWFIFWIVYLGPFIHLSINIINEVLIWPVHFLMTILYWSHS